MISIDENKPLPDHTDWNYSECYAKLILETMFPERYSDLTLDDRPDLRGCKVGIEVTSAIPPKEKEASRLWSKIPFIEDENKRARKIKRLDQLGIKYTEGLQQWPSQSYSLEPLEQSPYFQFLEACKLKISKLNSGKYAELPQYDLFVHSDLFFCPHKFNDLAAKLLTELLQINNYPKTYSFVYLLTQSYLVEFDLQLKKINNIALDRNFFELGYIAREMVIKHEKKKED